MRWTHVGEGADAETEEVIKELLAEAQTGKAVKPRRNSTSYEDQRGPISVAPLNDDRDYSNCSAAFPECAYRHLGKNTRERSASYAR